jgi:hypothetical protein
MCGDKKATATERHRSTDLGYFLYVLVLFLFATRSAPTAPGALDKRPLLTCVAAR